MHVFTHYEIFCLIFSLLAWMLIIFDHCTWKLFERSLWTVELLIPIFFRFTNILLNNRIKGILVNSASVFCLMGNNIPTKIRFHKYFRFFPIDRPFIFLFFLFYWIWCLTFVTSSAISVKFLPEKIGLRWFSLLMVLLKLWLF